MVISNGGLIFIEQLISIENALNNKTLNRHQPRDKAKIFHVEKAQTISRASQLQKTKISKNFQLRHETQCLLHFRTLQWNPKLQTSLHQPAHRDAVLTEAIRLP